MSETDARTNPAKKNDGENVDFEAAMAKLSEISKVISSGDIKLEDALKSYEEGMKYYRICEEILSKAEQKIETYE